MNCESMEALLAGYLANDATLDERTRVEEHLLECAVCRAEFATAKAGWDAARSLRVAGLPGEVDARAKRSIAAQEGGLIRFLRFGTAVAASVLIAVALFSGLPKSVPSAKPKDVPAVMATVTPPALVGALTCVDPETKRPVGDLSIQKLSVTVEILDGVAQTTVEEIFFNETNQRLEGTFRFPLPPDASITRLAMEIDGKLMEGECVERQKARQTYEGIVRRMKDPALLEWMPGGLFSCRIFPIEAKSPKRIIIGYQQALSAFDGRFQYVYPLVGEATRERAIGQFAFTALVKGTSAVSVSSASHGMQVVKKNEKEATASLEVVELRAKHDVVVDVEMETPEAVVVANRSGDTGTFNLFLAPRADAVEMARAPAGTVFVVDCSASMTDSDMDVARRVAEKLIDSLKGGTVQVIGANVAMNAMASAVELKEKRDAIKFLFDLKAGGALDLAMALRAAMTVVPDGGDVVFVGEGTPSLGETDVAKIAASAREAAGRKQVTVRAVAVGSDADRPTLEGVARAFHGGVHAISPSDDVNARIGQIARTLGRAAMTDVKVEFEGASDVAPAVLGGVYFGERTMVSGRYAGTSIKAVMTGSVQGRPVRREWRFDVPAEEKGNLWVRRLWAQRRVADLMAKGETAKEEITKLGVACQLMTPYTSFLVLENEKAYEEHSIERTKKETERLVKREAEAEVRGGELARRREVLTQMAQLLDLAYKSFDERKIDKTIQLCNEILVIDPHYTVALELKEDAQKSRHKEEYYNFLKKKVDGWKQLTSAGDDAVLPYSETVRFPSAGEWDNIKGRLTESVIKPQPNPKWENQTDYLRGAYDGQSGKHRGDTRSFRLPLASGTGGSASMRSDLRVDGLYEEKLGWRGYPGTLNGLGEDSVLLRNSDFPGLDINLATPLGAPLTGATFSLGDLGVVDGDGRFSGIWDVRDISAVGPGFVTNERFTLDSNIDLPRAWDELRLKKSMADADVYTRQMEVQMAQMQDLTQKIDDYRQKLARGAGTGATATQELQYARQEAERLSKDLAVVEEAHITLARGKMKLEEVIAMLNLRGVDTSNAPPLKALEGKVTACDDSIGMVVISIGKDDGVLEGNEFTIYRGGSFIAKITINKVERKWAAGRVTLKKEAPRVNDDASNHIFVTSGTATAKEPIRLDPAREAHLRALRAIEQKAFATWRTLLVTKAKAEAKRE